MNTDQWARGVMLSVWRPPNLAAIQAGQAVARGETFYGNAWPGTNNWGAVQCAAADASGQCPVGTYPSTDTHPTSSGGAIPYAACFCTFSTAQAGAQKFLNTWLHDVAGVLGSANTYDYALAMYQHHYYEGQGASVNTRILNYSKKIYVNAQDIAKNLGEPLALQYGTKPGTKFGWLELVAIAVLTGGATLAAAAHLGRT